jgi:ferredoxin
VYRIEIDRSLCSGFGSCAELAPASFRIAADGLAAADTRTADQAVLDAAASCPMGAISVFEELVDEAA